VKGVDSPNVCAHPCGVNDIKVARNSSLRRVKRDGSAFVHIAFDRARQNSSSVNVTTFQYVSIQSNLPAERN